MASELFKKLYQEAMRRDCAMYQELARLNSEASLNIGLTTSRIRLAEALVDITADFVDTIRKTGRKYAPAAGAPRLRALAEPLCPICESPYCHNANTNQAFRMLN